MRMQSVNISLQEWGDFKDRYTGSVRFTSHGGDISVNLDPDTSDKVLAIVADQLISSASTVAALMREDIKRLTSNTPHGELNSPV